MSSFTYRSLIDISHCLSSNRPVFNPSIVRVYKDYYLVCYRQFDRRAKTIEAATAIRAGSTMASQP